MGSKGKTVVDYTTTDDKEIVMATKGTTMGKKVEIKEVIKPLKDTAQLMSGVIKIPMTGEAKGECLIIDLEDFFERMHRQGWGCVKRQKL